MKKKECAVLDVADAALARLEQLGEDVSDLRRELAFAIMEK